MIRAIHLRSPDREGEEVLAKQNVEVHKNNKHSKKYRKIKLIF